MKQDILEIYEQLLEKQGFSRMYGRILAIIYLKEVPMTQEDLEKQSNFSRSSINKAVNTLEKFGYVRKRQKGEGKKLAYYIELGPKDIFLMGIRGYLDYLSQIAERFARMKDPKVEGIPSRKFKDFIEHIPEIKQIFKRAFEEIDKLDFLFT